MKGLLKTAEKILIAVGVGLSFYAALEALRAYQTLRELHPWAGYGFLAVLALLLAYLLWQVRALFSYRTVLLPPPLPDEGPIEGKARKALSRHLDRITGRLGENPLVKDQYADHLLLLRQQIERLQQAQLTDDEFRALLLTIEKDHIAPLLVPLDKKAESLVADNVGLVSLGTALSPYRSVDLYIVLARNLRMINQIIRVYRTRPTMRETVAVFYDIARVVAAVNLLHAMDNIWTGLGRHMPLVGRYGEAASEGLFSGLLTSVAGHAAIDRCRAYRSWSKDEAVRNYRSRLHRWAGDVMSILKRHGIARLFGRKEKMPGQEERRHPAEDNG